MERTLKVTVDPEDEKFQKLLSRSAKNYPYLNAYYIFVSAVLELIVDRINEAFKDQIKNFKVDPLDIALLELDETLSSMADWIEEDVVKSFALEFKVSLKFIGKQYDLTVYDFCR